MAKVEYVWRAEGDGAAILGLTEPALTRAELPAALGGCPVTSIAACAFRNNVFLTTVLVPEGVVAIGDLAFEGCHGLKSVRLPGSLTRVGQNAFGDCPSLKSVFFEGTILPQGLELPGKAILRAPRLNQAVAQRVSGNQPVTRTFVVGYLRQAADEGKKIEDPQVISYVLRYPKNVLNGAEWHPGVVKAVVKAVCQMPVVGKRHQTLVWIADECAERGQPELAAVALEAASQEVRTVKVDEEEGLDPNWLFLP